MAEEIHIRQKETQRYIDESNAQTAGAPGKENILHLRNKDIADILETDRSTVTRDLQHIKQHPSRFKILLKDYMDRLEERKETDDYRLRLTYQRQEHLNKWIGYAYSALDYLVRELDVSVS